MDPKSDAIRTAFDHALAALSREQLLELTKAPFEDLRQSNALAA